MACFADRRSARVLLGGLFAAGSADPRGHQLLEERPRIDRLGVLRKDEVSGDHIAAAEELHDHLADGEGACLDIRGPVGSRLSVDREDDISITNTGAGCWAV